jgi:hypothetical protein
MALEQPHRPFGQRFTGRRRRRVRREQATQALGRIAGRMTGVGRKLARGLVRVDPARNQIEACQRLVDHRRGRGDAPAAHRCDQILRRMHRQRHRRQVEQARGPLQGMKGAQQLVHPGVAHAIALDPDQGVGRLRDQVARFGDELFAERAHRGTPVSTAT